MFSKLAGKHNVAARRCFDMTAGCMLTYAVIDLSQLNAQEQRKARRLEVQQQLWDTKAKMYRQYDAFKGQMQQEKIVQAGVDTGKLLVGLLVPAAWLVGDAINVVDLYQSSTGVKDVVKLEGEEVLQEITQNENGKSVVEYLLEAEGLEKELSTLDSQASSRQAIPTEFDAFSPPSYWRRPFYLARQAWIEGSSEVHSNEAQNASQKVFDCVDGNADGTLTKTEFVRALRLLDGDWNTLADGDTETLFFRADLNGDGKVSLREFQEWIKATDKLVHCFHANDTQHNGVITESDFTQMLDHLRSRLEQDVKPVCIPLPRTRSTSELEFKEIQKEAGEDVSLRQFVEWIQGAYQTKVSTWPVLAMFPWRSSPPAACLQEKLPVSLVSQKTQPSLGGNTATTGESADIAADANNQHVHSMLAFPSNFSLPRPIDVREKVLSLQESLVASCPSPRDWFPSINLPTKADGQDGSEYSRWVDLKERARTYLSPAVILFSFTDAFTGGKEALLQQLPALPQKRSVLEDQVAGDVPELKPKE